jgi:hypothetical protein
MSEFLNDLTAVINRHSKENDSNTPDWILAQYMGNCLNAFTMANGQRESWYGCKHEPGMPRLPRRRKKED